MGRPAGVQIRRWFFLLVGLLLVVDGMLLGTSLVMERSIREAARTARPLTDAAAAVRAEILAAQRDLFRYLAEFADSPGPALAHLERLKERLRQARSIPGAGAFADELDAIRQSADRYRKVLELLPGTVAGTRDWNRIEEYGAAAVRLGAEVEQRAERLVSAALEGIRKSDAQAARLARWARWGGGGGTGVKGSVDPTATSGGCSPPRYNTLEKT